MPTEKITGGASCAKWPAPLWHVVSCSCLGSQKFPLRTLVDHPNLVITAHNPKALNLNYMHVDVDFCVDSELKSLPNRFFAF